MADLKGRGLQRIQRGLARVDSSIERWEVEGGEFRHLIGGLIVHAADEDADEAHGVSFREAARAIIPPDIPLLLRAYEMVLNLRVGGEQRRE